MCGCNSNLNQSCYQCAQTVQLSSCAGCQYTLNSDCVIYNKEKLSFEPIATKDNSARTLTTIVQAIEDDSISQEGDIAEINTKINNINASIVTINQTIVTNNTNLTTTLNTATQDIVTIKQDIVTINQKITNLDKQSKIVTGNYTVIAEDVNKILLLKVVFDDVSGGEYAITLTLPVVTNAAFFNKTLIFKNISGVGLGGRTAGWAFASNIQYQWSPTALSTTVFNNIDDENKCLRLTLVMIDGVSYQWLVI
jgi:ACT domain-containing protein